MKSSIGRNLTNAFLLLCLGGMLWFVAADEYVARSAASSCDHIPTTDRACTSGDGTHRWKRLYVAGTAHTSSNFSISAWGGGSSIQSVSGDDNHWQIKIRAGTTPGATPSFTLTFADGTWTNPPYCTGQIVASTESTTTLGGFVSRGLPASATSVRIDYLHTVLPNNEYTFEVICLGA